MNHLTTARRLCAALAMTALAVLAVPGAAQAAPKICDTSATWQGAWYCDYGTHTFTYPAGAVSAGTVEIWVVGTDYNVWTRWKNASGSKSSWVNMQGNVTHSVSTSNFDFELDCNRNPYLVIKNASGVWMLNKRGSNGTWSGWTRGDGVVCVG